MEKEVSSEQSRARAASSREARKNKWEHTMTQQTYDRLLDVLRRKIGIHKEAQADRVRSREDATERDGGVNAQGRIEVAEKDVKDIIAALANPTIISPRMQTDVVKVGNVVSYAFLNDLGEVVDVEDVIMGGELDVRYQDPKSDNRFTHPGTPLGAAMRDKKVGDTITFTVENKRNGTKSETTIRIKAIKQGNFVSPRKSS